MIKPLWNNVLIEVKEMKTKSGLILSTQDKKMEKGTVIAVGQWVKSVKKGDVVFFKSFDANVYEIDGKEFTMVKDENLDAKE